MRYYLDAVMSGSAAEIRLNDVPVVRWGIGGISVRCCVNMWVVPGLNVVTLKQIPPKENLDSENAAQVSMTLRKSVDNDPERSVIILERNQVFTEAFFECDSSEFPVRPAWLDLPVLTSADIKAIRDFVGEFHEAVRACNSDKVLEYVELSLKAGATAFGFDLQAHRARYQELINELFEDRNFQVAPLAENEFDFPLCGDGRLLSIVRPDGSDVIRSLNHESGEWSLPLFIGIVDGRPLVVA